MVDVLHFTSSIMNKTSLFFTAPQQIDLIETAVSPLSANEILVQTDVSAISPGTEMLMYQGLFPPDLAADSSIEALAEPLAYPFQYGYSTVGQVVECGEDVDRGWLGRRVFAFNPHETFFVTTPDSVMVIPDEIDSETAVFLPNMETAVSFVMDGEPAIGENVLVLGQGIVGLLTTALLAQFPLASLITADLHPNRLRLSEQLGANATFNPLTDLTALKRALRHDAYIGADLVYELSGNPKALDLGIETVGYNGRIVVGSWYGQKTAALNLGGHFHRSQLQIISSQVSFIAPKWNGRWSKQRRFQTAWQQLQIINPTQLITHRIPFKNAHQAYQQLQNHPDETIQAVMTY